MTGNRNFYGRNFPILNFFYGLMSPALFYLISRSAINNLLEIAAQRWRPIISPANFDALALAFLTPVICFLYWRKHKALAKQLFSKYRIVGEVLFVVTTMAISAAGITVSTNTQIPIENTIPRLLSTVVFGPICEEVIYRGLTLEYVYKKAGTLWAVLLTSLLFGASHFGFACAGVATIAGIMFSIIQLKFKSILITIIVHSSINFALSCTFPYELDMFSYILGVTSIIIYIVLNIVRFRSQ